MRIARARRSSLGAGGQKFDVVFYTPFIGWMLSPSAGQPPGGAETQILRLAKALAARGARVAIIAYDAAGDLPSEADGVSIISRPGSKSNKRLAGKVRETARIWRALRRAPAPTVVYRCAGLELGIIGLYTRLTRRRLVFSSASVGDFDFARLLRKRRDRLLYQLGVRLADVVVVQTEEQAALCEERFGRAPVVIKSLATPHQGEAGVPRAFLWVGRLVSYKRPLDYLDLARALPDASFWMLGVPAVSDKRAGGFGDDVLAQARGLHNVRLLAPRPQPEVEQLMGEAVASVNTADFEGMPNVLLEAWCRGVPALVLRHDPGGVVARFGLGGFADGSPERLAVLARELWDGRSERRELSERCQRYIARHHSPETVARQWASVLSLADLSFADAVPTTERAATCAA